MGGQKTPLGARDPPFPDRDPAQSGRKGGREGSGPREGGRALDPGKEAFALGDGGKGGTVETEIEEVE